MIRTTLPMLTAGNLNNLDCETWQKLVQFLQDNPHVILVLNGRKLLLFSKESYVKIRKSLYDSVEEFNMDFSLDLVERSKTDTFTIASKSVSKDFENMEILAVEVSASLQTTEDDHEAIQLKSAIETQNERTTNKKKRNHKSSSKEGRKS